MTTTSDELLIYPQDIQLLLKTIFIPFLLEFFRIMIGYFFGGQSSQYTKLEDEKLKIQLELSTIKSIQLELVRHSKLERKLIKLDKELETLKASQGPKEKKIKSMANILRAIVYLIAAIYFSTQPVALISPKVFWPVSWFVSSAESATIPIHAWFMIVVGAFASRHVLRSVIPLFANNSSFP